MSCGGTSRGECTSDRFYSLRIGINIGSSLHIVTGFQEIYGFKSKFSCILSVSSRYLKILWKLLSCGLSEMKTKGWFDSVRGTGESADA